jgi:hypothetical protein
MSKRHSFINLMPIELVEERLERENIATYCIKSRNSVHSYYPIGFQLHPHHSLAFLGYRSTLCGLWAAPEGHSELTSILDHLGSAALVHSLGRRVEERERERD